MPAHLFGDIGTAEQGGGQTRVRGAGMACELERLGVGRPIMTRANAIAGALLASILLAGAAGAQDTSESPAPRAVKAEPTPASSAPAKPADPVAQEMVLPKIIAATVDWKAARDALAQLPQFLNIKKLGQRQP